MVNISVLLVGEGLSDPRNIPQSPQSSVLEEIGFYPSCLVIQRVRSLTMGLNLKR